MVSGQPHKCHPDDLETILDKWRGAEGTDAAAQGPFSNEQETQTSIDDVQMSTEDKVKTSKCLPIIAEYNFNFANRKKYTKFY